MSFFTHQALFKQGQILANEFTHQAGIERHREAAALNLEERSDGQAGLEKEYVYYARLEDVKVLATASHVEHHEQWEIRIPKTDKNASAMRVRVRKTTDPKSPDSAPEYVETKKIKLASGGEQEIPTLSSEDAFNAFKLCAEQGMIKTRYTVAIEGRKGVWEIDTFAGKDGKMQPWCKLDYEVVEGEETLSLPNLPFGFVDIIPALNKTPEQESQVRVLYDRIFLSKNRFITPAPIAPAAQLQDNTIAA